MGSVGGCSVAQKTLHPMPAFSLEPSPVALEPDQFGIDQPITTADPHSSPPPFNSKAGSPPEGAG